MNFHRFGLFWKFWDIFIIFLRYIISAKIFIDTTGDGRLGAEAYVPYIIGRESKTEFNESLAELHSDNETEGSSFAFTSRDYGVEIPFTPPSWGMLAQNWTYFVFL